MLADNCVGRIGWKCRQAIARGGNMSKKNRKRNKVNNVLKAMGATGIILGGGSARC